MAEKSDDGMYVDGLGNKYLNETEADSRISDMAAGKGGGDGGATNVGGAAGGIAALIAIIVIGPIVIAKIMGWLWGKLLELGMFGRIITTLLMLWVGPFLCAPLLAIRTKPQDLGLVVRFHLCLCRLLL